jgi:hypothetical protein
MVSNVIEVAKKELDEGTLQIANCKMQILNWKTREEDLHSDA